MDGKLTDRQRERKRVGSILQLVSSTDVYFNGWVDRHRRMVGQTDRHRERDGKIDRQRDTQTDRQRERQANRYTD